jgi:hypothetical protein
MLPSQKYHLLFYFLLVPASFLGHFPPPVSPPELSQSWSLSTVFSYICDISRRRSLANFLILKHQSHFVFVIFATIVLPHLAPNRLKLLNSFFARFLLRFIEFFASAKWLSRKRR